MANFVTVSYGLVTRETSTSGELPVATVSADPWIDVSALNPRPVVGDHYDGAAFTLDHTALMAAQGAKIAELRDACANHVKLIGFPSGMLFPGDAQPREYCYPSEAKDQDNVRSALGSAITGPAGATYALWCGVGTRMVNASQWDMRDHTVEQVKAVANNLRAHVEDAQFELKDEIAAVLAATTVAAVNAIVWVPPTT